MKPWICLIGFRCSGKSTIGRALAEKLAWKFFDTDEFLIEQEKRSISELFQMYGELRFRMLEAQCLFRLPKQNLILSSGGGLVENIEAINFLKRKAVFVYLKVPMDVLIQRRREDPGDRPLLFGARDITEEYALAFENRKGLYESIADVEIPVAQYDEIDEISKNIRRICGIQ